MANFSLEGLIDRFRGRAVEEPEVMTSTKAWQRLQTVTGQLEQLGATAYVDETPLIVDQDGSTVQPRQVSIRLRGYPVGNEPELFALLQPMFYPVWAATSLDEDGYCYDFVEVYAGEV